MQNNSTIPKSRGWRRHHELRAQDAAAKAAIERALLAELGRPASARDQLAAEQLAALTVWARVLERRGKFKDAAAIRSEINRVIKASGFKPEPAASPKPAPGQQLQDIFASIVGERA